MTPSEKRSKQINIFLAIQVGLEDFQNKYLSKILHVVNAFYSSIYTTTSAYRQVPCIKQILNA